MSRLNITGNLTSIYSFEQPLCLRVGWQIYRSQIYFDFIYDAIGIPLNIWILVAILTSIDLRSSMRNKVLATVCAQGLLDCLVIFPMSLHIFLDHVTFYSSCHTHRAFNVIVSFSEFISNWNLVTLLALVLFTLYGSSVTLRGRNRLLTQAVTFSVLLWPWFFSAIIIIPTVLSNYREYVFTYGDNVTLCITSIWSIQRALYAINTGVPACLAAVLLAAIIVMNRKRAREASNRGKLSRQLIGDSSNSEPFIPYIAITAVIFVCDVGELLRFVNIRWASPSPTDCAIVVLAPIVECLEGAKEILLPLMFLLFPEVRCQAKRLLLRALPGHRSADVTVAYVKDI